MGQFTTAMLYCSHWARISLDSAKIFWGSLLGCSAQYPVKKGKEACVHPGTDVPCQSTPHVPCAMSLAPERIHAVCAGVYPTIP